MHAFSGGGAPFGVFTEGSDGNFYGTLRASGLYGFGTVFKITPTGTLTTLYNFAGPDGAYPNGVIQGVDGNFYGTTFGDQTDNQGTLFQITPSGVLTTIHSFTGPDGARPAGGLRQATDGNLLRRHRRRRCLQQLPEPGLWHRFQNHLQRFADHPTQLLGSRRV